MLLGGQLLRHRQQFAPARARDCGGTAADPITERLRGAGLEVATIYGQGRFDVEAERLRFQTGQAKVCVFTTVASISLHAGESLPGGRQASTDPRVGVFHQARFSGIAGLTDVAQLLGADWLPSSTLTAEGG